MKQFMDERDWFFEKRFGLFLHWGLYALEGYHEQDQWRCRIPRDEYIKRVERWNPAAFDPDTWIDLAQEAGMEYMVLTTKHHDGFCLFQTDYTDFHVGNTPYKKDMVKEYVDACHRRGMKVGLYYSVVDWNQKNYSNEGRHHELPGPVDGDEPDMIKYMEFLKNQVRELCSNYGEISCFWWDMNVSEYRDPSINNMIRELQPSCVINGRGMDEGDYSTPEREWDEEFRSMRMYERPTESCNSVSTLSWGYRKEESYYSDRVLLRGMARSFTKGGNYLLNVGPDAEGVIPLASQDIIRRLGRWYKEMKYALTECSPASDMVEEGDYHLTRDGNTFYLFICAEQASDCVVLKPIVSLPRKAILLNTGKVLIPSTKMLPMHHNSQTGYLHLYGLPVNEIAATTAVIKIEFDEEPQHVLPRAKRDVKLEM